MKHTVIHGRFFVCVLVCLQGLWSHQAFALQTRGLPLSPTPSHIFSGGEAVFQAGGYVASQGTPQNIGILGLRGDRFTLSHRTASNYLLGLGYFINGFQRPGVRFKYGLNAFYLAKTSVRGEVIQEHQFTNLSYRYTLTNFPLYLATKMLFDTGNDRYSLTADLGVGPNLILADHFSEYSLDGVTLPDNAFKNTLSAAFSATAGLGIQFNRAFRHVPVALGYRFFWLGQGQLDKATSQLTGNLKTGNSFAQALTLTVSL